MVMQNGALFPQSNNEAKARPKHILLPILGDPPIINPPNDLRALRIRLLDHSFLTHRNTHLSLISDTAEVSGNLRLRVVYAWRKRWDQNGVLRVERRNFVQSHLIYAIDPVPEDFSQTRLVSFHRGRFYVFLSIRQ